ncbi:hypothetical protein [Mycobacterium palustre]|nr:hypothetical protein [Mycobacterium palustre]MCV7100892.1 hypothetical protein [Mycobacterium palustre]
MQEITPTTAESCVPLPAGAMTVGPWEHRERTGLREPIRYFTGSSWVIAQNYRFEDFQVIIQGAQDVSGTVERVIRVSEVSADNELTLAQARQLAEALAAAVDEAQRMNGYDRAVAR